MKQQRMFWVAADPSQPGAAFAACADEPLCAQDTADNIAAWRARGAEPQRVDGETMVAMLNAWKQPGQVWVMKAVLVVISAPLMWAVRALLWMVVWLVWDMDHARDFWRRSA